MPQVAVIPMDQEQFAGVWEVHGAEVLQHPFTVFVIEYVTLTRQVVLTENALAEIAHRHCDEHWASVFSTVAPTHMRATQRTTRMIRSSMSIPRKVLSTERWSIQLIHERTLGSHAQSLRRTHGAAKPSCRVRHCRPAAP